jgi:nitroreductase / dihydropteridine reductase
VDFKDIVKNRYSCRSYQNKPVPEEIIGELLDMARLSVSGMNLQPWKIKVVSDQETKDELFGATFNQTQVKTCSHLLVLCANTDYDEVISRLAALLAEAGVPEDKRTAMVDMTSGRLAGMSQREKLEMSRSQVYVMLGNVVNGAYSLGLAACPMAAFKPEEFSRILGLSDNIVPTLLVSVGYAADQPPAKVRHSLDDILI